MNFPPRIMPNTRMRRMRHDDFSRRMMRETILTANDFILPVFVHEKTGRMPVDSMPGVERLSIDELLKVAEQALKLGVPVLDLFGVPNPDSKTADGRAAWDENGIIQRAIRALKSRFPELGVMACLLYTSPSPRGCNGRSGSRSLYNPRAGWPAG